MAGIHVYEYDDSVYGGCEGCKHWCYNTGSCDYFFNTGKMRTVKVGSDGYKYVDMSVNESCPYCEKKEAKDNVQGRVWRSGRNKSPYTLY